ncbi:MAG: ribose-phosphate pyrophosphokinase [Blautia sp.]|nr:ribose-phosphate pyrophosphokinase [Blautia sp.]
MARERTRISTKEFKTLPVGRLGLIPLISCQEFGKEVDDWLVQWRNKREHSEIASFAFEGYQRDSYKIKVDTPRFGSGEGKGTILESVRGDDIYILVDVCNYSITYQIGPYVNQMSPDDHFQDLKRVIAAVGGKARRINVIMPYLYESRQDTRSGRESLDCANALQELIEMGVENIITFDAHEPRVQNATPLNGFETVQTTYQFIKALLNHVDDIRIDNDHFMIVSPDEGGMGRAIYLANVLSVNMGMFYKRLDYTKRNEDGQHPIAAYEFLGQKLNGQDIILIDDMISSGRSALTIASLLKKRGAGRIFICATFGHFTAGFEEIDKAYEEGIFDYILTTNLIYQKPELLEKPYYINVDMSKYVALIIDTLNHDQSVSYLLDPVDRINVFVENYMARYE